MSFAAEKLPIFPYEIDGKKGFVNTKFELVTKPEFYCDKWENSVAEYSKYAAIASKNEGRVYYVIVFDGTEVRLSDPNMCNAGLIGEDYYFVNYGSYFDRKDMYAELKSLWNKNEVYIYKGVKLNSGSSPEWIVVSGSDEARGGDKIINLKGELKWIGSTRHDVGHIYLDDDLIFIRPTTYSMRMIDCNGQYINDFEWSTPIGGFSDGLFACGKYFDNYQKIEIGFYNKAGERIIPLNFVPDDFAYCSFHCGVAPVIYENGVYTIYTGVGKDSDNWVLIDTKGKPVVKNISAFEIGVFCEEGSAILTKKTSDRKKQILINVDGEPLNSYEYDWIKDSVNGYYRARRNETDYVVCAKTGKEYKCKDFKK